MQHAGRRQVRSRATELFRFGQRPADVVDGGTANVFDALFPGPRNATHQACACSCCGQWMLSVGRLCPCQGDILVDASEASSIRLATDFLEKKEMRESSSSPAANQSLSVSTVTIYEAAPRFLWMKLFGYRFEGPRSHQLATNSKDQN